MKTLCAWCGKSLRDNSNGGDDMHAPISHGICPECTALHFDEPGQTLREYLNTFDVPILAMEGEPRVVVANETTCRTLGKDPSHIEGYLGGEVTDCTHAQTGEGCGNTVHCKSCVIRNTLEETLRTGRGFSRVKASNDVCHNGGVALARFEISTERIGKTILLRIDDMSLSEKQPGDPIHPLPAGQTAN